jgi:8-oxo-dGTP pyrophosphatase MutT (NUDIX family)
MRDRDAVRVLLVSPQGRLLLIKYRNTGKDGVTHPCWTTAGGGIDEGETIESAAAREIVEETGIRGVAVGPIVWYCEDSRRSGDWQVCHKEHFVVAVSPTEALYEHGWTEHERGEILEMRWWSAEEILLSRETIYPPDLGTVIKPILAGQYPDHVVRLPDVTS